MSTARQVVPQSPLQVQIDALCARVAALEARLSRSAARETADVRVGHAIAAATDSLCFTCHELLDHRRVDPDLKAMLADALIDSPRQLAKVLRRLERMTDAEVT